MNLRVEQVVLPAPYGAPSTLLAWSDVAARIEASPRYWLSTMRPDGTPHARPLDGIWLEGTLYFGGDPQTVWFRNLKSNPALSVHLEDGERAVIMDGRAVALTPDHALAERLARATNDKYGYGVKADALMVEIWTFTPVRALAWNALYEDATRFTF